MFTKSKIMGVLLIMAIVGSVFAGGGAQKVDGNSRNLKMLVYNDMTQANTATDWNWTMGQFRSNNAGITVEEEILYEEPFHQKTQVYSSANTIPDVLYVWPSGRSSALHQNKQLKDLTRLIQRDGLSSQFAPSALDPTQQMGYMAMIPRTFTYTHVLLANTEVLRAAGLQVATTYDELRRQAPILRARGIETITMGNKETWVMQSCMIGMLLGRFVGSDWYTKIHAGTAKFTDPDYLKAFEFVKTLYTDGVVAASTLGNGTGDAVSIFANGRAAYFVEGDWKVANFITDSSTGRALIPPARQGNITVTVFPTIAGAKVPSNTTSGVAGTGWGMSAAIPDGSPREEAAWTLIKWLVGREVSTLNVDHGAYLVSTRTDIRAADLSLEPIQVNAASSLTGVAVVDVVFDAVFHNDINEVCNNVLQEIGLGSKTAQQAAAEIQQAFDRAPVKK